MPILAALGTAAMWWRAGAWMAAGFVAGSVIAYANFYWLKRIVNALADKATHAVPTGHGHGVVARFLVRYVLIAVAAYVIIKISTQSLYGMLWGLFLPVGAIICEAGYEMYTALRRGI
jgi:hypothetical protein